MGKSPRCRSPRRFPARAAGLLMLLLLGSIALTGCGPRRPAVYPVSGVVLLDDVPVEGAAVLFSPEAGGRPATGVTQADGSFQMMTFDPADGALPGWHQVTVTLMETTGVEADPEGLSGAVAPGGVKENWIVPKRYSLPATSELRFEVKRNMEPVKLELSAKP